MANADGSLDISRVPNNSETPNLDEQNESGVSIQVGDTFENYEHLSQVIDMIGKQSGTTFTKRDSKLVVRDIERTKNIKFDDEDAAIAKFRYSYIRFACKRYGIARSRGKGIRPNQSTQRIGCPAQIIVSVDSSQDCFIVRSVHLTHNHTDDTRHCYRQDEIQQDFDQIRRICVRGVLNLLEDQLAYSRSAITAIEQTDDHFLVSCINENHPYTVDLAASHCNCQISARNGLPCSHIFAIRHELGFPAITVHDLPPRYRRRGASGSIGAVRKNPIEDEALQETLSTSQNLDVIFTDEAESIDKLPFQLECGSIEEVVDVSVTGNVNIKMEQVEEERGKSSSTEHKHNTRKRKLPNAREVLSGGMSPRRTKTGPPIQAQSSQSPRSTVTRVDSRSSQTAELSESKNTPKAQCDIDLTGSNSGSCTEPSDQSASRILLIDGSLNSNTSRRKFEFTERQKYRAAFNLCMKIADLCAGADESQFSSRLELLQDLHLLWEAGEDATIVQVISSDVAPSDS